MGLNNCLLAVGSYALSAGGVSGASLMVLSYAMSAPNDYALNGGCTLTITNGSTTGPIHVEARSVWQGLGGVSCTTAIPVAYPSNVQTYGGSAVSPQSLALLLSGQDASIPYPRVVGSAIQIWVLAASSTPDNAGVSGAVALWGNA